MASVSARLVAVVGPTAAGKSALGLAVARAWDGEIVSCDSLQVYRGLDIGSAKPTREDQAQVPHHLIDIRQPEEDFSAADFARLARAAILDIHARGRLPVIVGGTGLYLRALLSGIFEGPSRDEALRARLEAMAERFGNPRLHRLLRRVDPSAAARIHPQDRLRIVRALEVYRATGRPISAQQRSGLAPLTGFATLVVGVDPGREALRERVLARTRDMLARGLVEEVRRLRERERGVDLRALRAIGYRQAVELLEGKVSEAGIERAIVTATMQYAKRQRTWFRHQIEVSWFGAPAAARAAVDTWLATFDRSGATPLK